MVVSGGFPHAVRVGAVPVLGDPSFPSDVFHAVSVCDRWVSSTESTAVPLVVSDGVASAARVCVVEVHPLFSAS